MRIGFRTRMFLAVFGVAGIAVLVAATLLAYSLRNETQHRIEGTLAAEARLVAELLSGTGWTTTDVDAEADRLGTDLAGRLTFIGHDGRVLGDSSVPADELRSLDNHGSRPEVLQARNTGIGIARRHSATLGVDLLYVAVPVRHPAVAFVRVALPLTEIRAQTRAIRRGTIAVLAVALASALGLAWFSSALLGRRVNAIAEAARRYAAGDLSRPAADTADDELGTVAGVLDQTVRKLRDRLTELTEDRARMDAILGGMREGVIMVDAQGLVQMINRAAREMLRLEDRALGRPYREAIRNPGLASLVGAALGGDAQAGLELSPSHNPAIRLVARAAPVATPGGEGAVLVLHDITDLRHADQIRRDFVANVSHELRTPLTAIRGYVEALRDEPPDPEDRERFLEIVARHTERMERLVKDLLRLTRLEARQEPVELGSCSIESVVNGAVGDLAAPLEAKHQRVEVRVSDLVGSVVTDAAKLQDALRNIIENASAYAPDGTLIEVEATAHDEQVILTVADRGPGIPEADLVRIFERFYRVDKARSRESGGTGLGLSIVKHLVDRLAGRVWAANRPGGGAVFTIDIPRVSTGSAPPSDVAPA